MTWLTRSPLRRGLSVKVLLVTPPMSDLNTPYPATAYLTSFLRAKGTEVEQRDWSLEVASRLFSASGLDRLVATAPRRPKQRLRAFLRDVDRYQATIEGVVSFLRGSDMGASDSILERGFLPEGAKLGHYYDRLGTSFRRIEEGNDSPVERASYLATQYLQDIVGVVAEAEPGFRINSYASEAARKLDFGRVLRFLRRTDGGLIPSLIDEVAEEGLVETHPDVLGITIPFPGNLVGALRVARVARRVSPETRIVMGGGFPNCYLRDMDDPRFFDFADFLTLDDGEWPLWCILEHLRGERPRERLFRTFTREDDSIVYRAPETEIDIAFRDAVTPSYEGLPLDRYLATRFDLTPAARLWARRWNKMTLAHGCYWRKCTFCDTSLDYVQRYEPQRVERLVAQIEEIVEETGHNGFHWVDEAAPPALLKALSQELVNRRTEITWWGNIRFEKSFTPPLAKLMAKAGCAMVTGGLEVASDRLLAHMNKGVTVEQVARVSRGFADAGVTVHAYLMYGFPSQTVQETVDSLEVVRQLFEAGCLHSGHWHRFMVTAHSPIGRDPEAHGVRLKPEPRRRGRTFAEYSIPFRDGTRVYHELLEPGLTDALVRFRRGLGLERPVHEWFPIPVPGTTVPADRISRALADG
jgi:Radical SAM superfamily